MSVVQTEQCEETKKERQRGEKKPKSCKEEVDPVLQYPMSCLVSGSIPSFSMLHADKQEVCYIERLGMRLSYEYYDII